MTARAVVFAGPSIAAARAREVLDVEVLPPVRRGDVDALFRRESPPRRVGIVDGVFLQALAVSPKEILAALDHHDVAFYGSSSMGALRAAELADLGMVPVGAIAGLYRGGEVDADDEVAITYDPRTLEALSEPMVNIRLALAAAVRDGTLPEHVATAAVAAAKALYFPDRSWPAVVRALSDRLPEEDAAALRAFVAAGPPDAKRDDAIALLRAMAADDRRETG
jgi:hypothetical protein